MNKLPAWQQIDNRLMIAILHSTNRKEIIKLLKNRNAWQNKAKRHIRSKIHVVAKTGKIHALR